MSLSKRKDDLLPMSKDQEIKQLKEKNLEPRIVNAYIKN